MCKSDGCGCFAIAFSIIIGIVIAALFFLALIPNIVIAVWIALVLATLILLVTIWLIPYLQSPALSNGRACLCRCGRYLIIVTIGTILLAIASLAIVLVPGSLLVAILIFIGTTLFSAMIMALISLLDCIII